jgi:hypothetical protein
VIAAIIAAEVTFWALLLGGLALRYLVRVRRLSSVVLAAVPLVDLALVVLVAIDVLRGAEPTQAHALAAMYLGISVAFGPPIIRRADAWFRYRFADGPRPSKPPRGSSAAARALWREWIRLVFGALIAGACLLAMIVLEGRHVPTSLEEAATSPYWAGLLLLAMITFVWFLAGPAFAGRGDPSRDAPPENPLDGVNMPLPPDRHHHADSSPRAPWWLYLVILLGANYLRSWLLPTGHLPAAAGVGIALGQAALLFVLITAVWRVSRRHRGHERQ